MTFLIVFAVFSVLIIVHELGHMFAAKRVGIKVETFSLGLGKKLFGIKKGDTEYIISIFPFGGYVKLAGDNPAERKGTPDEFLSKSVLKRFFVIVAGSFTNYIFAFLILTAIFTIGFPVLSTKIGKILPNYPASESALKKGDRIVEIDGKKIKYFHELLPIVESAKGDRALELSVKRNSRILKIDVVPKVTTGKNIFGQEISVAKIGIMPVTETVLVRHNLFEAAWLGAKKLTELTAVTYKGLWLMITGGISFKERASGPIGIAFIIGQAAEAGLINLLITMAYISMALAVFNLLPIPVLDGGHVIFLLIEKLRGRPLSVKTQETITQVALYLLIALFLFVSWNDINRFIGR